MNRLVVLLFSALFLITSCTYVQKIKDGTTAYDRKQFDVAIPMLKEEYKKEKSRIQKGKLAYMLAESYSKKNESDNAIDWYQKAFDNGYGVDALKGYAYSLKKAERYEEAKRAFKELGIEIGSPYEYRREIVACETALQWKEEERQAYTIELMDFNSKATDFAPTIYKNGQLVISSDRSAALGEDTYNWTGNKFMDLFIVDPEDSSARLFDNVINTAGNEGTATFNQDYTEMIFTRCYGEEKNADAYCKLMSSSFENNSWTAPVVLGFVEDKVNYTHPSLSPDGGRLYFSSNHPDGWGGYDIYVSERTPEGWDYPQLMGRTINSEGNETFPFIDKDTLYFSSDFHPGMGGLDIFRTYKMDAENWVPIHNLKPPINSGSDDFAYVIDYNAASSDPEVLHLGYFSSSRFDGKGKDDIYKYEKRLLPPPPPPPVEDSTEVAPIVYKMILEGYVLEKIFEDASNPNSKVLGRRPLGGASVQVSFRDTSMRFEVDEDGYFSFELEEDMNYDFFGSKADYLNNNTRFSSKGIGKDPANPVQKFTVELVLDKIFRDREITLENIYYNFEKWDIRDDAKPTLDKLAALLQRNPQVKIQLSSHTDCRGNDGYNQDLSQKRAQSVVDYLISKGIGTERLTPVGYGEERLEVECICTRCSEDQHQANRRTTFKVLE
ncbi:MAG: OmpA family protein [Bacteroidota bacterium]